MPAPIRPPSEASPTWRRLTRAEVHVEMTWNLADIFPTPEAWETEMAAVEADIPTVTTYRGKLGEGTSVILACLEAYENLAARTGRVSSYSFLNCAVDATSAAKQEAYARAQTLMAKVQAAASFIRSEILTLHPCTVEGLLADGDLEGDGGLSSYRPYLRGLLRQRPHQLSQQTEEALVAFGEVLGASKTIYDQSKMLDMSFPPATDSECHQHPLSFGAYEARYQNTSDQTLRRSAWASFTAGLKGYRHTYAATWSTMVRRNIVHASLRRYESARDMFLDEQGVPLKVYDSLHDVILAELAPHMRRYAELRRQVLGLDRLLYCDLEVPLDPGYLPAVTVEEGREMLLRALGALGGEYRQIIADSFSHRWIDWAENIGKSPHGTAGMVPGVHPYVMVTWTGSMRNTFTLAHELGHAAQMFLSYIHQEPLNSIPSRFFMEAPSTANEAILGLDALSSSTGERRRLWVLTYLLASYHHNFVRHLIEGELERRIYALAEREQAITERELSGVQGDILREFWGDILEIDDGARLTWMRQPHYYRGLYSYAYAAGLTIGTAVALALRDEGEPAAVRWVNALKACGAKGPLELAQIAGVDLIA